MFNVGIELMERGLLPWWLVKRGVRSVCKERITEEEAKGGTSRERLERFVAELKSSPVAIVPEKANEQHYEVPAEFFQLALGRRLKYSSCLYPTFSESLDEAEEAMLAKYIERAEIKENQTILELGCGWGSFSLYVAEKFPSCTVYGVSNSASQREFIMKRAAEKGIKNLTILTADMNEFSIDVTFDRIVSIEMFEHMRNYKILFERISNWLKDDGKLFVHIFCHKEYAYPYETEGTTNWMGRYFFSGGIMPSFDLFREFNDHISVEADWKVNGRHYELTSQHWIDNMELHKEKVMLALKKIYGESEGARWFMRWKVFFLACAELFGYDDGNEWFVGHYRFVKNA